jgi:outer membrane protein TolC
LLNAQQKQEAGGDKTLSLQEAVDFAVKNCTDVKNAQIDIEIAKKKIWETTSIGLPQVAGKISYQNIFNVPEISFGKYLDPTSLPGFGNPAGQFLTANNIAMAYKDAPAMKLGVAENFTFDLTVSQILFSGEYLVGVQASKTFKMLSEQGVKKAENDIKEVVANTYQIVLITQQSKTILDSSLINVTKIIEEMTQMNKSGFIEETDVDQLRLTETNLKNSISTLDRQIEVAKNLLKFQMGMGMEQKITLTDKLDEMMLKLDPASFATQQFNPSNNIGFQMLETQEKLTMLNLKRYKAQCLPTIVAFYRHQEMDKNPSFNFNPKDVLGISMDIPIFASGQRHVKQQQVKLELQKIANSKENVTKGLTVEYTQSLATFNSAFEKYNREKESVKLAKKIYDKSLIKYKKGVSSSLELTQAQNQYLQSQSTCSQAIFELLNAKNKMEKVLSSSK